MKNPTVLLLTCALLSGGPLLAGEMDPDRLLMIGAGVSVMPEYEGGKTLRSGLLPFIQARRDRFSFDGGPRYDVLQSESGVLSLGVSYDDGRRDYRPRWAGKVGSDYLHGLGRVEGSPTVNLRATQHVGAWEWTADVTRWVGHEPLLDAEIGASLQLPAVGGISLTVGAYADWSNTQYMQTYFGVTAAQAARSGFPAYAPRAGLRDVRLVAEAGYAMTPRWLLFGSLTGSRLIGDAGDSPVVQQRNGLVALFGVAYRFF